MGKREEEIGKIELELRESNFSHNEVAELLAANQAKRCYYPEVAKLIGDVETAIFLSQVEFWWRFKGNAPFYKYVTPCDSSVEGDTWLEELGISRHKINSIISLVTTRVKGKKAAEQALKDGKGLSSLVVSYKPSKGAIVWYFNDTLFMNLRRLALEKYPNPAVAIIRKSENGHNPENGKWPFSENQKMIYTEQQQNNSEQTENFFVVENEEDPNRKEKREEVKAKATRPKNPKQQKVIEINKNGTNMSLDFYPLPSTMSEGKERGFDSETLEREAKLFRYFCTIKQPDMKSIDWERTFLDWWMVNYAKFEKQREEKYGKSGKSAGDARLEQLQELTNAKFDTTDIDELADRVYRQLYAEDEKSPYA